MHTLESLEPRPQYHYICLCTRLTCTCWSISFSYFDERACFRWLFFWSHSSLFFFCSFRRLFFFCYWPIAPDAIALFGSFVYNFNIHLNLHFRPHKYRYFMLFFSVDTIINYLSSSLLSPSSSSSSEINSLLFLRFLFFFFVYLTFSSNFVLYFRKLFECCCCLLVDILSILYKKKYCVDVVAFIWALCCFINIAFLVVWSRGVCVRTARV